MGPADRRRHGFTEAWEALGAVHKALLVAVALVGLGAAGGSGLAVVADSGKNAAQDAKLADHDHDLDLLHQTQLRMTTDLANLERGQAWQTDVLWDLARTSGIRPEPPPTPQPVPRAWPDPSAHPSPTPTP